MAKFNSSGKKWWCAHSPPSASALLLPSLSLSPSPSPLYLVTPIARFLFLSFFLLFPLPFPLFPLLPHPSTFTSAQVLLPSLSSHCLNCTVVMPFSIKMLGETDVSGHRHKETMYLYRWTLMKTLKSSVSVLICDSRPSWECLTTTGKKTAKFSWEKLWDVTSWIV